EDGGAAGAELRTSRIRIELENGDTVARAQRTQQLLAEVGLRSGIAPGRPRGSALVHMDDLASRIRPATCMLLRHVRLDHGARLPLHSYHPTLQPDRARAQVRDCCGIVADEKQGAAL